jgi:FAD/FMN-containing dehydrogenase
VSGPPFRTRRTWRNHLGNQSIDPLRLYSPRSIDEVVAIVQEAEAAGETVRAVGSGHSWSDAALTGGFMIDTKGLAATPSKEPDFIRAEWSGRELVRVGGGTRVKEINEWLDGRGLGLSNMGGFDHQTIAGVISTSTHGSGISFGPLNDFVCSLDMVVGGGRRVRFERAGGPTDPAAFEGELVQDDTTFDAVAVGMGSLGVICTVMLEVRPRYFLREVRAMKPWDDVQAELADGALERNRHYELLFTPYARKHEYPCLVTTRNVTEDPRRRPWSKRTRNVFVEAASLFPLTPRLIDLVVRLRPSLSPMLLENAMRALVKDEYDHVSYEVLNIGAANFLPAYSAEVGVPVERRADAAQALIDVAAQQRSLGDVYQSAPISFRFVKASPALMSMMYDRDTMMIELIQLRGIEGAIELTAAYEEALLPLGGRPHWGQLNWIDPDRMTSLYPRFGDWQAVRAELDPNATFASPFTARVGITG